MPAPITPSIIAFAALVGVAASSTDWTPLSSGKAEAENSVTRPMIAQFSWGELNRFDRDESGTLDADEFTAMQVVKAELANLNGFIVFEIDGEEFRVSVPAKEKAALSRTEHIRLEAIARQAFYRAAGDDKKIDADELIALNNAFFNVADQNSNDVLSRAELTAFAAIQSNVNVPNA